MATSTAIAAFLLALAGLLSPWAGLYLIWASFLVAGLAAVQGERPVSQTAWLLNLLTLLLFLPSLRDQLAAGFTTAEGATLVYPLVTLFLAAFLPAAMVFAFRR